MGLIEFIKRFICSRCESTAEVGISFIDTHAQTQTKDFIKLQKNSNSLIIDSTTSSQKIRPLTSYEVFNMNENEIEADDDEFDSPNFSIEPLPLSNGNRPTLVLDLDNTLIYASTKELVHFDHQLTVHYNNKTQKVWIIERPGLKKFLDLMSQYYELVLFTAGIRQYGIKVMKKIDPNMRIGYFLDRRFCTFLGRNSKNQELYTKNIQILGRNEKQILLIDDREYSFALNTDCGILIPSFDGDLKDQQLEHLSKFLISSAQLSDLRSGSNFHALLRLKNSTVDCNL